MVCMIRIFQNIGLRFDAAVMMFAHLHPGLFTAGALVGIPLFILAVVFAVTSAVMIPAALLLGWT
ncbi:hypothetical protein [Clostridium transplantifaecale]|uniref:hypothetical protein n=1 Tax=Clostridium transplantifaecale TaxID=2479838 RepID=UPI000F642971|nr:hypothetical protein [Clostridium transplantifaecale]